MKDTVSPVLHVLASRAPEIKEIAFLPKSTPVSRSGLLAGFGAFVVELFVSGFFMLYP